MTSSNRALNISQLAKRTGYSRAALAKLLKPHLIGGKLTWGDYCNLRKIQIERTESARSAAPAAELQPRDVLTREDHDRIERRAHELFYRPHRSKKRGA
jgi:hypothetical protein